MMRYLLMGALLLAPVPLAAQNLTIGFGGAVTSTDPHYYNAIPNLAVARHVFDTLVGRSPMAQAQPALAESWQRISETVWEFKLREGVRWHDGAPLTAEDVAASYRRVPNVPNSPSSLAGYLRMVNRVEVVDARTLRIHTNGFYPILPTDLATICIVPQRLAETATTEDFNTGRAMIGTGPYRFVSYMPKDRTVFERNDQYWGDQQHWQRVTIREIPNAASRSAALLSGDVDLIDQVPAADLPRLGQDPRVRLNQVQGLRLLYIQPDFSHTGELASVTDNDDKPLPRNPFLDVRVRRALSMAIDRTALEQRVMEGVGQATMQWMPEGTYGYTPDLRVAPADVEGAKRLLAEAGFPNGFRMTLSAPNDRYPNDSKLAQAVAQMWTRIGVRTQVDALPWSAFVPRVNRQEFAIHLLGWGSTTGEGTNFLTNVVSTFNTERRTGNANAGRYSNPTLDALAQRLSGEQDEAKRQSMLQDVTRMAIDDVAVIPLQRVINYWATSRALQYTARMDDMTIAMGARPAE